MTNPTPHAQCTILGCTDRAQYRVFCWWRGLGPSPDVHVYEMCGTHRKRNPLEHYMFPFATRRMT